MPRKRGSIGQLPNIFVLKLMTCSLRSLIVGATVGAGEGSVVLLAELLISESRNRD